MKKTTLALSIITAFGLWGCVGSSSSDDQPIDQGHSQQQHHINPSQNTDNNNDNGNSENAGSTSGSAGGAAGHISGGSTGGQPIADNDSSDDDKTGGNDDDHDDHSVNNELDALVQLSDEALQKETTDNDNAKIALNAQKSDLDSSISTIENTIQTLKNTIANDSTSAKDRKQSQDQLVAQESLLSEKNKAKQELAKKILENVNQGINLTAAKDIKENNKAIDKAKKDQPQSFINIKNAENAKIRAKAANDIAEKNKTYAQTQSTAANDALNAAIAAQGTALNEKSALPDNASEEAKKAADEKLAKAKEAVTKAQQEKATAEQKLAEESAKASEATEELNTAKADVKKAKELDQNRGVAGEVPSDPLSVFTSVSQVTREGNHAANVWNITFKDGETLSINPAVAWNNNMIGERKDSTQGYTNYNEHYFGNIGKQDGKNLAIVARADSVYGYYGDKFFAVGTVTPKEKMDEFTSGKFTYLGSAFLKADDGTDLVSKVSATANWANKKLTGSFSDFKSYKPDDVANGAVSKGASNVAAYDKLGNEVEFAEATIDGNRFYSSVSPTGTTANVYGYFYGVEPESNKGSHQNGGEIAGLVQYSKFHGAFGAKHFEKEKKNTSDSANASGSTADTNTVSH